ncbi:MAG: ATP-grasp domain-containing protein [Treponema sp.]|jgi:biotin carboxylase|nr:ATP-grasp domain-containing protein [Treponema sp.]
MKERLMILGAGVMQGPAIRIAKELGLFTVALDGSAEAPCVSMADRFERIDLKDREGVTAFGRSLQNSGGLAGIMTAGTDFSATVAWAAERLGLPGIPHEAALNASDKSRMRSCFKKAGLPSPEFVILDGASRPPYRSLPGAFPLVVKPVDSMGGRGCRRVDSPGELGQAAEEALGFSRSRRVIVETFMEGPEFSVDAILYHGEITICGLADRHIFFPPYFIEMGHTMPAILEAEKQEAILETFRAGIRALGLAGKDSAGAAKGDIKLGPSGPMIGEIAARLSGGYMSGWTYPYASGTEPVRAAILAAIGRKPEGLRPLRSWTSAERAFISIPGTVRSIHGLEAARGQNHVKDLFLRIGEGSRVSFPVNNVTKCGNVISAAPDRAAAAEAAEKACRSILIRLETGSGETGAFLAAGAVRGPAAGGNPESRPDAEGQAFPPAAFQAGPDIEAALLRLPEPGASGARETPDGVKLVSFPEFTSSELRDYAGRTAGESLEAVRLLTGLSLPEVPPDGAASSGDTCVLLGRSFWAAFVRGGYQGAVYFIDSLLGKRG